MKVDSYPEFQKMALPTYNVNYIEIVKNGLKAVELWEDGGFKYSKIVKEKTRFISDVIRQEK